MPNSQHVTLNFLAKCKSFYAASCRRQERACPSATVDEATMSPWNAHLARPFTKEPSTMKTQLYHARYFGGPCDGMVVVATRLDGEDPWSIPIAITNGQIDSGGRSTMDICRAVYKLSRTCHLIQHGTPTIRYEYEFVGLEVAASVTRSVASGWLAFVKIGLKRLFQPNLWLPRSEGRPKRPGYTGRLVSHPGRGVVLKSNRSTVVKPTGGHGGFAPGRRLSCDASLDRLQRVDATRPSATAP